MGQVLQFPGMQQALNPAWMPLPGNWMWPTPDGQMQGFGASWRSNPGLANLLWLSLDMEKPPRLFDCRQHELYMLLFTYGQPTCGTLSRLVELAELTRLRDFPRRLETRPEIARIPRYDLAPLLITLADQRIKHAHT